MIELRAHADYWAGRPGLDAVVQLGVDGREQALGLFEFAPCVHVAEVETGIVFDERLSAWGRGAACLGTRAAVWSGTRAVLGA